MNQTIEELRQRLAAVISEKAAKKAAVTQNLSTARARVQELTTQLKNLDESASYETVSGIKQELKNQNEYIAILEDKSRSLDVCSEEEKAAFNAIAEDARATYNAACSAVWQYLDNINSDILAQFAGLAETVQSLYEIVKGYEDAVNLVSVEHNSFTMPASIYPYEHAASIFPAENPFSGNSVK